MSKLLLMSMFIFIALFIYLGQALWVYLDGRRRGDEYGWLWTILCLTNFPVPLIIYFLVTRHGMKKCRNCEKKIDKNLKTCPYCGEAGSNVCPKCGSTVEQDWNFCPNCNEKIK
jgi:RNA polymerase subunit RPABC4/transcription elongation factor Spt4